MTDRPRRSDEDVVDWAVATGRFRASRADLYRRNLAEGKISAAVIESLAPVDLDEPVRAAAAPGAGGRPSGPVSFRPGGPVSFAQAGGRPVRAASAGDPAADLLRESPGTYESGTLAGPAPELFPGGGTLPLATASGLAPQALAGVPWWLRPGIAEATTLAEAVDMLQMASTDEGADAAQVDNRFAGSNGLHDFQSRVTSWAVAGGTVAGERAWAAEEDRINQVSAAAARPVDQRTDDELYDTLFGSVDRHRASLADKQRRYNQAQRGGR